MSEWPKYAWLTRATDFEDWVDSGIEPSVHMRDAAKAARELYGIDDPWVAPATLGFVDFTGRQWKMESLDAQAYIARLSFPPPKLNCCDVARRWGSGDNAVYFEFDPPDKLDLSVHGWFLLEDIRQGETIWDYAVRVHGKESCLHPCGIKRNGEFRSWSLGDGKSARYQLGRRSETS